jgi:hypothetical protein
MKFIDTESPFHQLPFGCGTIAICNALQYKNKNIDTTLMKGISKAIKESQCITKANNMHLGLDKHSLTFSYIENISFNDIKNHLNLGKSLILLSFDPLTINTGVGHYSFIYGSKKMAYETNKLFCDIDILNRLKVQNNQHKPIAWLIN